MNQMGNATTNPLGKDTKNLGANLPIEVIKTLKDLAEESGHGISTYLRLVLIEVARRGVLVEQKTVLLGPLEPVSLEGGDLTDAEIQRRIVELEVLKRKLATKGRQ